MRVWDTRSGSKTLKLRGHADNIRALLLDSTGRFVDIYVIHFSDKSAVTFLTFINAGIVYQDLQTL